jgi:hypothetical protein
LLLGTNHRTTVISNYLRESYEADAQVLGMKSSFIKL